MSQKKPSIYRIENIYSIINIFKIKKNKASNFDYFSFFFCIRFASPIDGICKFLLRYDFHHNISMAQRKTMLTPFSEILQETEKTSQFV